MRLPILTVLPAQAPLRESALNMAIRREAAPGATLPSARIRTEDLRAPDAILIDPDYPAVPIGSRSAATMMTESTTAEGSAAFAVRGEIEVAHPDAVPEEIDGHVIFSDPQVEAFLTCAQDPPLGDVAALRTALDCAALAAAGLDGTGVAIGIVDGGINLAFLQAALGRTPAIDPANSWTAPRSTRQPLAHPVGHGTMCAFDALVAAPKATLIDMPVLGAMPGGNVIAGSVSAALQAYSAILGSWAVSGAPGSLAARYDKGLVLSNSWGMYHSSWDFPAGHRGRYCDNPNHPFDLIVSALVASGVDVLFAAGNCGAQCPAGKCQGVTVGTIMGANAHGEVLTIAGCDLSGTRVGYSSAGPPIAGRASIKPDLTAYTHFRGSEVGGAGSADTGTSAACPVAAGCVAALRSRIVPGTVPPAALIQTLQATAKPAQGQIGRDDDHGAGIVAPLAAAQALGIHP